MVDLSGKIHERIDASRVADNPIGEAANEVAIDLIEALIAKSSSPVLGIGVGTPGVVDADGRVLEATNLDWHGVDLANELRLRFDIPVSIANDAQVEALAEFRPRPADHRNLILVKLGTGIGAGLVLNGSLYKGEHSAAVSGSRLGGRRRRKLPMNLMSETVASVPAILRRLGLEPLAHPWDARPSPDWSVRNRFAGFSRKPAVISGRRWRRRGDARRGPRCPRT